MAACHELFGNPSGDSPDLRGAALALAIAWPPPLIAIFSPIAVHRCRRLDRCPVRSP